MKNDEYSHAINIKDNKNRKKRYDSIGTPESPFQILLLNILKKHNGTWVKNEELGTSSCK